MGPSVNMKYKKCGTEMQGRIVPGHATLENESEKRYCRKQKMTMIAIPGIDTTQGCPPYFLV